MKKDYILRINENQALNDGSGAKVSWISGQLSFPKSNKMPAPDVLKILTKNPDLDGIAGLDVSLDIDKDLYMLPIKHDEGVFFGADYICAQILYGQRELIEKAEQEMEAYIVKHTKANAYPSNCNPPVVAVWHLANNESLLTFHFDTYMDFDIPSEVTAKDIINIPCGAFSDDLTAHYMLSTIIYKWIQNTPVKDDDIDMENFEDNDEMSADAEMYVQFNNGDYSEKQKDLFINLSRTLFCDFMNWHKTKPEDAEEQQVEEYVHIAKKLKKYAE